MQVKKKVKEELDLTKVAEAFGGHIVEQEQTEYEKQQEKQQRRRKKFGPENPTGKINPGSKEAGERILKKIKDFTNQQGELPLGDTGKEDPVKDVKSPRDIIGDRKKKGRPFGSKNKPKETSPNQQLELPLKDKTQNQQTFDQMFKDVRKRQSGEKPVIDDPFGETKTKTKTKTKPLPSPEKIKTKTKSGKVTGDVESDFVGPKKPIRDRNRILQKVRVAARKTKRPVQHLAKPLGKLAARNPFAAAIVGTDLLDRAGRAIPKPSLPKMDVGVVGRRTAGQ